MAWPVAFVQFCLGRGRTLTPKVSELLQSTEFWVALTHGFVLFQTRLLGTLAVSRGLGDHQLKVIDTDIEVKPFLSYIPQVSD